MNDDDIKDALHDAVSGVRPRRGVESIEARLDERRGGRGWLVGVAAAVAAIVVVTGGVAWLNHRANAPRPVPASEGRDLIVQVYYLGQTANGPRLFSERHQLHGVTASDEQAAVAETLGTPEDPDYRSGFPAGTTASVTANGDHVTIDFHDSDVADPPRSDAVDPAEAVQALVWTLNSAAQRPVRVSFRIDGRPADTLLGAPVDGPVTAGNPDDVLSPVSVELSEGAQIASGSIISGHAATFEANVVWELRQGEQVVRHGFTTAGECCTLSPYAFRLDAPQGSYTLVVHDTDESGQGRPVTSDTKDIVVQ